MLFSLTNLIKAYFSCRQRKRKTINALKFELDWENKLLKLQKKLKTKTWNPGRSICFAVTYPKVREIFAADFCDRVVHHLLVNQLEPFWEKRFIYDSFACRKNKGCNLGIQRLHKFIRKTTSNKTQNAYFLQVDVKSFFCSINKNILFQILKEKTNKWFPKNQAEKLDWLTQKIIFHDPTKNYYLKGKKETLAQIPDHKTLFKTPKHKGLPIGNLTSQFFANAYLNELDQYVKRKLKMKYYLRYADDMVLLSQNKQILKAWREQINSFLKHHLDLELHPKKDKIGSVWQGINFIGFLVKPNYTLVRKRSVSKVKEKLHYINKGLLIVTNNQRQEALPLSQPPAPDELERILAVVNSYYGHFRYADTFKLRKNLYEKHFSMLKKYLEPAGDNYFCFKIKREKNND
jgi:hypothetical protein